MKISIDENLKGKELFEFLIANKSALIAQKKSLPKFTEAVSFSPILYNEKGAKINKAADVAADATTVRVKVVANTSLFIDSQMDLLLRDSAKKSIKERKGMIPHLHDHVHSVEAEVGDVMSIYYEDISLRELGWNKEGSAQSLIFETDIKKSYNSRVFNRYKENKIKQHSIGLQYMKIELAINDEDSEKEYDFWNKYYEEVINKEVADKYGFFWVVPEYKLLENSCVLFGSNILTPTLEVKHTDDEPTHVTHSQPKFDLVDAIKQTTFLNP